MYVYVYIYIYIYVYASPQDSGYTVVAWLPNSATLSATAVLCVRWCGGVIMLGLVALLV